MNFLTRGDRPTLWNTSLSTNALRRWTAQLCLTQIEHIATLHAECNHRAKASVDTERTLLHRPRKLSVISTYVRDEAQTACMVDLLPTLDSCMHILDRRRCEQKKSTVDSIANLT